LLSRLTSSRRVGIGALGNLAFTAEPEYCEVVQVWRESEVGRDLRFEPFKVAVPELGNIAAARADEMVVRLLRSPFEYDIP
jgi:hypothetical protein